MSNPEPIRIDIVSDVVCPWCIIGYKQLYKALTNLGLTEAVDIHWQPFELNPHMPAEGQELREHLAQKYGPAAASGTGGRKRLVELGKSLGFEFDYYEGMRMANTFKAHQLLHWAEASGKQTALKLALFGAFFSQRKDVSDEAVLLACVAEVGLDAGEAAAVLADGREAAAVRETQQLWLDRDIAGVPAFFFFGKYMLPGAQEAATFERVLTKILQKEGYLESAEA